MIKRFYTAFTIYIMVMLYATPAYSINFFFSHLGVEDGLSQVSVLDIFQDSDGYIWFGTRNGANRYDGYEFVIYQNEVNNNATLTDNYIRGFADNPFLPQKHRQKMHHQRRSTTIEAFRRKCLCFLQPVHIQMQHGPDSRTDLARHGNLFTGPLRSTSSGRGHLYRNGEQRLVHLFRKLETKTTYTSRRYHNSHTAGRGRKHMAGAGRSRNLPFQQREADFYLVAQRQHLPQQQLDTHTRPL